MAGETTGYGPTPLYVADEPVEEMVPSFSTYLPAAAGNVIRDSPVSSLYRATELAGANAEFSGEMDAFGVYQPGEARVATRSVSGEDAKAQAEAAGVKVNFGDTPYTPEAVEIMINRARSRAVRDVTIGAYNPSWATQLGVSLVTSLADPLNVAAAFIPFVGEARYGALLEGAVGAGARTAIRARAGAIEGLGGAALVEPLIYSAATQEGRDYSLADSMYNLAFGTAFGAGLHAAGGAVKDKLVARRLAREPAESPADIVERLPVEVKEAALRGAVSDLISGRAVQSAEIIDSLASANPAIREQLSVASALRRDGPDLADLPGRVAYWEAQLALSRETRRPMAKLLTEEDRAAAKAREDRLGYLGRMQAESGAKKNTSLAAQAKAIAGHEQQLLATESARQSTAATALETRQKAYQALAKPPTDTPPVEFKPEPAPKAATAEGEGATAKEAGAKPKEPKKTFKEDQAVLAEVRAWAKEKHGPNAKVSRFGTQYSINIGEKGDPNYITQAGGVSLKELEAEGFVRKTNLMSEAVQTPSPEPRIDSPPAPLAALSTPEIMASEAQFRQVEAETMRRVEAMASQLEPETLSKLQAMLARVNEDAAGLEDIYNTAVQCLLNPAT